ncbi:MAG: Ig-like domain-containing protein [Hominisplanchenecus sp.]
MKNKKRVIAMAEALVLAVTGAGSCLPMTVSAAQTKTQQINAAAEQMDAESGERKISFNSDWKFSLDESESMNAEKADFDDSQWRTLDLPHDYSIEMDFDRNSPAGSGGGYLNAGVGWYRKTFVLPESMAGKRISIDFGGVYMDSTTYVNGEMIGNYPYGYSTFAYDITDQLVADGVTENVIAVRVNNQLPSSRWYSGSGIYRNVNLVVTDDVHVERYGTFVKTPELEKHYKNGEAVVSIETKVANDGELPANAVVTSSIYDSEGNLFCEPVSTEAQEIAAGDVVAFEQMITTTEPKLWSVDDPNLYELVSEISVDGEVVDTYETTFGFRWITMDPNEGFYLNGEYMKLNGMCMHHDQGALGAVANYRAIERQMETMKSMGVNAIRVTHNPAADELIEICNRLGLMVIDEAFDCWESSKRSQDYGRFFSKAATHPDAEEGETWAEFDIKNMVNRGKNDPCIIMWSIGNEIVNASVSTATKLVNWVAEVDPTRPATEGFNNFIGGFWDTGMKKVADVTGVVGFNYGENSYDAAHSEYPNWIIMGTETSSAIRSRGKYKKNDSAGIRSSYDDGDTVGWGRSAENAWKANRDRKFVMGEFVWTGFDYIGEPSPLSWPSKSSFFGAVDTAGIPKDAYYIYQSQWTTVEENPMVHLLPHWNWENDDSIKKDGKIAVQAYSNAASVELFLNGESLGEKSFLQKKTSDGRSYQEADTGHIYLEWQVAYEPGELKAVAKDMEGNVIATDVVRTAGEPAQVRLTPDREIITADGKDLSYILVEIVDKDGNVVPTADNNVKFQISGDGKIVGVDNGDSAEVTQSYKGNERKAYSGKAMVIVQSTEDAGSFTLKAASTGLRADQTKVFTTEDTEEEKLLGYEELDPVYVKKGETPELPETVTAVYSSGRKEEKQVTWDDIPDEVLNTIGQVTVNGTVDETEDRVSLRMVVTESLGIRPVHVVTGVGEVPQMPETVTSVLNTGEEEELPVTWDAVSEDQVAEVGSFTVNGRINDSGKAVTAAVRVAEYVDADGADIARRNGTYPIPVASNETANDPATAINDGAVYYTGGPSKGRWIAWGHMEPDEWIYLEFENPIQTKKLGLDFWNNYSDSWMDVSQYITVSYSMDGENWKDVDNLSVNGGEALKREAENIFTFDPVTAKFIRWNLHNDNKKAAGVSEVHVYKLETKLDIGTSAALKSLKVDGAELEGFSPDKDYYTVELGYGADVPQVTAEAEDANASLFVVPALSNNEAATVQIISEDGKTRKNYTIQFREAAPVLDSATIQMESNMLTEDDVKPVSLTATLQDGTVLAKGVLDVVYTVSDPELAYVQDEKLYAVSAGTITLQADVTYQGVTVASNELTLEIQKNTAQKVITGYEQVTVTTDKGVIPALPAKIRATFDIGLPKKVDVTWDAITNKDCENYGEFTVQGTVEGQNLRPVARVIVKGVTGVQQFSCATPLGVVPDLAEKARVYYSDGTTDELPITWEEHPQSLFTKDGEIVTIKGTVSGKDGKIFDTAATVRISADTHTGDRFTGYKNGFYWPLGIASFTNGLGSSGDSASELNDNIISHAEADNNRWCNWASTHRDGDWAGIIFGLEEVTYKYIDNLDIDFYIDHGAALPPEYEIEYYDGSYFNVKPADPNNVTSAHPTGVDANWKPVTNLQAPEALSDSETNHFTFDAVRTCAIRINMKATSDKCLGITEMCAYDKLVTPNTETKLTSLMINGEALENFDPETLEYVYETTGSVMPEITGTAAENASVTVIHPEGFGKQAKVIVTAENGVDTRTYLVQINKAEGSDLENLLGEAKKAQQEAEAARKQAETAKDEAVKAKEAAEAAREAAENAQTAAEEAEKKAAELAEKAGKDSEAAQEAKRIAEEKAAEAEAAKQQAEQSAKAAAEAESAAKAAQTEAEDLKDRAEALKAHAEVKAAEAEAAKQAAEAERLAAEAARKQAEEDSKAAKEAAKQAAEAQKKAEEAQAAVEKLRAELEKELKAANMKPEKVSLKSVKPSSTGRLKVNWKKVKDADGYQIQYAKNSKFKNALTKKTGSKATLTLKKLTKGQKYYVRVRAFKNTDSGNVYGAYSKVKKATVK